MDLVKDKSVSTAHTCTRIAAYFWIMFFVMVSVFLGGIFSGAIKASPDKVIYLYIAGATGIVFITAAIGCFKKKSWGRIAGLVACVICIPLFPIGTAASGLGFYGLIKGKSEYS